LEPNCCRLWRRAISAERRVQEKVQTSAAVDTSEGLTAREIEVLGMVATGLTDAEVAERLVVSIRTVHAHLRSIYRKLDVHTRSAATRFALEHDLVASVTSRQLS
jgi:DNA-binding NarL/FixJ family response regulator